MKSRKISFFSASLISLITFFIYLPALRNDFQRWDDGTYILNNVHIRSISPDFFRWAFFDSYAANWHPLTWFSHAIDYAVWGLNPVGHHLTNNILHAVNTFLVVFLIMKLMEAGGIDPDGRAYGSRFKIYDSRFTVITAGVTGLLFGLHPLQVESVAWAAERKNLLCAFFFLLTVMMYLKHAATLAQNVKRLTHNTENVVILPSRPLLYALCFFFMALLSKPAAVTLPLVLLVLDWHPLGRMRSVKDIRPALVEKVPFFLLSIASAVLTMFAQKAGGAMEALKAVPLSTRVPVALKALSAYLGKIFLPVKLLPFYPHPREVSFMSAEYLFAFFLFAGITAACFLSAKRNKTWLALWGYYVIMLIPVLGIIQVGIQSMADRYTYLPGLGPFMAIGLSAAWVTARFARKRTALPVFSSAAALVLFVSLAYLTSRQIGVWKNDFALWDHVVTQDPGGARIAYHNRGILLEEMGRLDEAIEQYQTALKLWPDDWESRSNLAGAYLKKGFKEKALKEILLALENNPDEPSLNTNLGDIYALMGEIDKAIVQWETAIKRMPDAREPHLNLAKAYEGKKWYEKAVQEYKTVLTLRPDDTAPRYSLGRLYSNMGRPDEAIEQFRTIITLDPGNASHHNTLGVLYGQKGFMQEAIREFREAVRLAPDRVSYRENLQRAMGKSGHAGEDK